MQDIINFIKEFEGIIGAVLGVVATLIVTDILKRKGKLNIYLMKCEGEYWYTESKFRDRVRKRTKDCTLYSYRFNFIIDVYNSSELPKIMRNIKANVYKGKELIKSLDINDEDTRRISQARCLVVDKANIFNINAKESYSFNLGVELPKEVAQDLKDGLVLKLNYKDEKNKDIFFEIFNGKIIEEEIEEE